MYQRVIINRKEQSVAVDRLDINWLHDQPFLGRRDLFMTGKQDPNSLDFIRHSFWLFKLLKLQEVMCSNWSACYYRMQFRAKEAVSPSK